MKTLIAAVALAGTLLVALAAPAGAVGGQGNGATVINFDDCFDLIGGGTGCFTAKGVIHEVTTPSGNTSFTTNTREHLQVIVDGEVVWDETSLERFHALSMDDALKELSSRSRYTVTVFGQTFCVQYHLHGTNGKDQFVRVDFC